MQLVELGEIGHAAECEIESALGPSPWNRYRLQSWGVRLAPKNSMPDLKRQLAQGETKIGRKLHVVYEENALVVNLRFIPPEQDHELVQVVAGGSEPGESSDPS